MRDMEKDESSVRFARRQATLVGWVLIGAMIALDVPESEDLYPSIIGGR